MSSAPLRALVVDDSRVFRAFVEHHVAARAGLTVVGSEFDAARALERIERGGIDVVLLDCNMPRMDGPEFLRALAQPPFGRAPAARPLVIAMSGAARGADELAGQVLTLGARGFVAKPEDGEHEQFAAQIRELLGNGGPQPAERGRGGEPAAAGARAPRAAPRAPAAGAAMRRPIELVGIAASTGGPIALVPVLAGLRGIGVPIVVVQHIPPEFVPVLCGNLTREAGVPVRPADDGGTLRPGDVVVSRGGVHVEVHRGRMGLETRYVDGPPEVGCKPAANVMFRSAANATQGNMVGVCLTGMGTDGAAGLEVLARLGGDVVVQDAATSLVYGMPRAVMATGIHAAQLPLHDMAGAVVRRVRGRTDDGCTANRSG